MSADDFFGICLLCFIVRGYVENWLREARSYGRSFAFEVEDPDLEESTHLLETSVSSFSI